MTPCKFEEANSTLLGGPAERYQTELDVANLPVYRGEGEIISCWKLTLRERIAILFHGCIWLRVAATNTHPPVAVDAEKPFQRCWT